MVEELKELIAEIRNDLDKGRFPNEAAVKQGIVLPILEILGWATRKTHIVTPEYGDGIKGRVDYALCHPEDKPIIFIEVKRVGNIEEGEPQLFEYATFIGVPMLVLSDGQKWNFYLLGEKGNMQERCVYRLDLLQREIDDAAERFERYLKYTAVCSEKAIENARKDYKSMARNREIKENLPRAWQSLVKEPDDELLQLLAKKVADISGGLSPDLDTCKEFILSLRTDETATPSKGRDIQKPPDRNAQGDIWFVLSGTQHRCNSAIGVLVELLKVLDERDSSFMERFANIKHGKKRRWIARDKYELYPNRRDLCENCSRQLPSGWFVGTNYSRSNIETIIRRACEVANISLGTDLKINLGKIQIGNI